MYLNLSCVIGIVMKGGVLLIVRVKPGSRSWLEALLQNLTVPGQLRAKNNNNFHGALLAPKMLKCTPRRTIALMFM